VDGGQSSRVSIHRHDDALGTWSVASSTPCPALTAHVSTLWFGAGQVRYQRDRILPSSNCFLLFNLGPRQYLIEPGPPERRIAFDDIWYCGPQQSPIDTEAPHGSILLGVAFRAGGVRPWLHADASECADRVLPLSALLGDSVLGLRQRLLETADTGTRFDLVEAWLLSRLNEHYRPSAWVCNALQRIAASAGQVAIASLVAEAGVSRKHFAERFAVEVGIGAKSMARILRFQRAMELLPQYQHVPWAELAAHCGYYDQSHLIRDFRTFSGCAPCDFLKRERPDRNSVVVR